MKRHRFAPDALIEVLHTAQELFGFLQPDLLHYVAHGLKLPPSRVYGVATFYHFFSFAPKGKHTCVVCTGTACYVKGADRLLAAIEGCLGTDRGQDDGRRPGLPDDGPLPGACGLAPVVVFDGEVSGNQQPETARDRLKGWNQRWISLICMRSPRRSDRPASPCGSAAARRRVASPPGRRRCGRASRRPSPQAGLGDRVQVCEVGCMRLCCEGPLVQVDPDGALYERVKPEEAGSIVAALDGVPRPAARAATPASPSSHCRCPSCWRTAAGSSPSGSSRTSKPAGIEVLYHVLREMSPAEVVAEITRSGLRGRGGAGYPTGLKWATVAKQPAERKFVVCNADEGDPGAFMDRSVLESDPHRVLEGMAIAAYAVGANQGYIYVRGEYPLAIQRLETAIKQAKRHGLLGSQIFDSPFDFKIDIRIGAGAFVCGEETALIHSIEGLRGVPRPRPPYPAAAGLWDLPTLINNVETFANIPPIIRKGGDWFASIGTEKSKGTKVFALAGKIRNTGLVEVPMGTTLRQIVEEIGGGPPEGTIKAVQTGGPSGGCIPADAPGHTRRLRVAHRGRFDHGLRRHDRHGPGHQHGGRGPVLHGILHGRVVRQVHPLPRGTVQLHRLLQRISRGLGTRADLDQLEALCDMVKHTSLCGLGQSAPNPVLSTLRYFRHEYEALIRDGLHSPQQGG